MKWPWEKAEQKPTIRMPHYEALATYNAEVQRGLMHTPEWQEKMELLQSEFDRNMADIRESGATEQ